MGGAASLARKPSDSPALGMGGADFTVVDGWLECRGQQLLAGPPAQLEQFADLLNLVGPPDRLLPDMLRGLMQMTRGCAYTPGEHLRRLGRRAVAA